MALLLHAAKGQMLEQETYKPRNQPIEKLMEEHALISKVLDAFDRWSDSLLAEGHEDRLTLKRFLSFFADFVDGAHHIKEERVLFAVMQRHGFSADAGPIAVMNREHDEGRQLCQEMTLLANQPESWTTETCGTINAHAKSYLTLLRNHIVKENQVLYPMADARLSADAWKEISEAFANIDEENECSGMYDENLSLAEKLLLN